MAETYQFQTEINQLMNIIINNFYSDSSVFLRELISNSSDALDKIRYSYLSEGKLIPESELRIRIETDKNNKILRVSDTGIGMTKQDLINNLGTIAKSGTREFLQKMKDCKDCKDCKDLSLIGSFGCGFYSTMLVSHRVEVISKHENDEEYKWSSEANGTFQIEQTNNTNAKRGTTIIMYLKQGEEKYLEENEIKDIVKKHSQFINYPIELLVEKEREIEEENKNEEKMEENNEDEPKVEDDHKNCEHDHKNTKTKKEKYYDFEQLNTQKPIWTRDPKDITEEEYKQFYKNTTGDWEDPLAYKHFKLDGQVQLRGILYIPKRAPYDIFDKKKKMDNVKLYVRRVLITENCDDFMPEYLSFVKGVVDSDDLPLNVSREFLQSNAIMKIIKNSVVKKCIELFNDLTEKTDDYKAFYESYHKNIKLGIHDDHKNKDKLINLLRFNSMKKPDDLLSFDNYIENMKQEQKYIYYITGESKSAVDNSPFLEEFKKRDYDVLYLVDPIDEYVSQQISEYKEKKLLNITKDGNLFDSTEEEKKQKEELEKSYADLCKYIKDQLGSKVEKVVMSNRLVDSPCVFVSGQYGWTANMERIMKAQALGNNNMFMFMASKKIMELNPNHVIMKELNNKLLQNKEDPTLKETILLLYDTCLLNSGYSVDNMTEFTSKIYASIVNNLTK